MGGTVTSLSPTQAENPSARLQQEARSGLPVMIPGAWEVRARRPILQTADSGGLLVTPRAATPGDDRERLERAREGGGAPSERTGGQPKTILARMWRYIMYPADAIVRRPVPQQR